MFELDIVKQVGWTVWFLGISVHGGGKLLQSGIIAGFCNKFRCFDMVGVSFVRRVGKNDLWSEFADNLDDLRNILFGMEEFRVAEVECYAVAVPHKRRCCG